MPETTGALVGHDTNSNGNGNGDDNDNGSDNDNDNGSDNGRGSLLKHSAFVMIAALVIAFIQL